MRVGPNHAFRHAQTTLHRNKAELVGLNNQTKNQEEQVGGRAPSRNSAKTRTAGLVEFYSLFQHTCRLSFRDVRGAPTEIQKLPKHALLRSLRTRKVEFENWAVHSRLPTRHCQTNPHHLETYHTLFKILHFRP